MAKKHVTQMTENEKIYLKRKVDKLNIEKYTRHVGNRMSDRAISLCDIEETIEDYNIIEYKMDRFGKQTVLIQSKSKIKNNFINIVIGLNDSSVVTCFKNGVSSWDVDLSSYNGRIDIRNLVKNDVKLNTGYYSKNFKRARA